MQANMLTSRAMTTFTLNPDQGGCPFERGKAGLYSVSCGMTAKTALILLVARCYQAFIAINMGILLSPEKKFPMAQAALGISGIAVLP